jgi:hypothetical protein
VPYFLEAVIVCDKYDDFLRRTLPTNKFLFDKVVVVTSHEDTQTRRVCEFYHVECLPTDAIGSRKGDFCKGCAINEGLAALSLAGWALHIDADIWLPPQTRELLAGANLDSTHVYGIDRFIVKGVDAWNGFLGKPVMKLQHEDYTWTHVDAFPLGTRVNAYGGYVPLGFFQLWNPGVSGMKTYPAQHTDAARGDIAFACQWPRSKRGFIPEVVGYHLESDDATHGGNWNGRTTSRF